MPFYECTYIMRHDINPSDVAKASDAFIQIVENLGGKLVKKEDWGVRALGYAIKKHKRGRYIMLGLQADSAALRELERNLKLSEDVLKYLSIKVDQLDTNLSQLAQPFDEAVAITN